jgi:Cft2 family RNA processing exonuclease
MTFRNLTRRRGIGANSYLLHSGEHRIILDAGMDPKESGLAALPDFSPVPDDSVETAIITHAHHDHIGALPVLQQRQRRAQVWMTEPTGELSTAMLHNSVNVMTRQREEEEVMEYPLFTHDEVDDLKSRWNYRRLQSPFLAGKSGIECVLHDAGHIMGAAGVFIREGARKLMYTGDVNFQPQTVTPEADFPTVKLDALIIESTRGSHAQPEGFSRRAEKERLAHLIRDTCARGGSVLIPVFALGKSQELLMMLHEMIHLELIPKVPVLIGGLSTKITLLYDRYAAEVRRGYAGFQIMQDMEMLVAPRKRRRELNFNPRTIYALSSGMMTEHTASNDFAHRFVHDSRNTVAFVGYTDPSTPGWRLRHAKPGELVQLDDEKPPVAVKCQVEAFDFSSHANREDICDYVVKTAPSKVVLVHGDPGAQDWISAQIKERLPSAEVFTPGAGDQVELW